jgi:large subunit ribosomal protein L5
MEDQIKKITKNIEKVVINTGLGKLTNRSDFKNQVLPNISEELSLITGQKPSPRQAKKSIAGFDVREGNIIGLKSTLRGKRMADFIIKINSIILPRVRDFKGIDPKNIDEKGNLNLGFKDQSVFPEIDMEKSKIDFGFQATIVPKTKNREEAIKLYQEIGFPFKKK